MKNTKTLGDQIRIQMKEEGNIMDFDETYSVDMNETPVHVKKEVVAKKLQAKYVVLRAFEVEETEEDMADDDYKFMDLESAMRGAAKKAVKGNYDTYVVQVLTKVAQVNYEALVKATPLTDTSSLIEAPQNV